MVFHRLHFWANLDASELRGGPVGTRAVTINGLVDRAIDDPMLFVGCILFYGCEASCSSLSSAPPPSHKRARLPLLRHAWRQGGAMILLSPSPSSSYYRTAPFPAATTSGSLRLAAAVRCSGADPTTPGNSALRLRSAASFGSSRR